jgi:hypothetical protein
MLGRDCCRRFKDRGIADLKQRRKLFAGEHFRLGDHHSSMTPFHTWSNFAQAKRHFAGLPSLVRWTPLPLWFRELCWMPNALGTLN